MATAPSWYSASLSSLSELDAHESYAQALTTSTSLHSFDSEPSEGPHPLSTSDIPTPPDIVIVVTTHAASGRQSEPVPAMAAKDPPMPPASSILGAPVSALASPEPPVDTFTEAPPSATEASSLFTPVDMPPPTLASSIASESIPIDSPISSPLSSLAPDPTQSSSPAGQRPANDSITIPVGIFAFLIIAAVGLVAALILGMVVRCTKTRSHKKGGNELQHAAGTTAVRIQLSPCLNSQTGPVTRAQPERPNSEVQAPESGRDHVRVSVLGWPKWAVKRVMGTGGDKRHVDFEMLVGKGAGS